MARAKVVELPLTPGANTDDTVLATSLRANDMDKVRTRGKRWETIGGWTAFNASGMSAGKARAAHTYADLDGNAICIAASESKVNAWFGGSRLDITPKWKDVWIQTSTIPISGGTATLNWTVYNPSTDTSADADHNLMAGDSITISGLVKSGGTAVLNGTFTITAIPSKRSVSFSVAGTSVTVDTAGSSGMPFTVTVAFRTGVVTGTGDTPATKPRSYSIDNFGENAVLCASDGSPVWFWQPASSAPEKLSNTAFASTAGWTFGSGWGIASNTAQHTGSGEGSITYDLTTAGQDPTLEGGMTYEMSIQMVTVPADMAFSIKIDAIDIFPPIFATASTTAYQQTYTFRFVAPALPQNLVITANSTGGSALAIDNVSIKQVIIATPISEAPQKNYALFVDGNAVLNVIGSIEADGDFNPTLLRWCEPGNFRIWVPDSDNSAGESLLGKGSYAVCGKQVGERNLILTNDAAYVAAWNGQAYTVRQIADGCGPIGTQSMAAYNGRAFWASAQGYYAFDGASVVQIQSPVKNDYVGKVAQYQGNKVFSWINTEFGEWWLHYPHTSDGTEISRYQLMSMVEEGNPWAFGTFDRTCMTKAGVFPYPIGIDTSGNIWNHEVGTAMSGSITLPYLETGYFTGEAGDEWIGCRRYYPDIESQTGSISWTITGKRAPQGTVSNTQVIGPKTITAGLRTVDFRLQSRQLKIKWASAATPTHWRLGVVGLEMLTNKARR